MKGLYVHIPFCVKKCNYCDFSSYSNLSCDVRENYISALKREALSYKKDERIKIDTVFFGGGTPSLLTAEEFSDIYRTLWESFDLSSLSEFTVEVNPKTLSAEKLAVYKRCGVNRISIGLQSIHKKEEKKLGRIHDLQDFEQCFFIVKSAGIDNINVDLMYGIPYQTKDSFLASLEYVTSLGVPHISVYGLMIEEGTPFYIEADKLPLPTEDEEAELYYTAVDYLKTKGYSHYEISNYAIPGFESKHNLVYWHDEEYIGIGLAAHSYFGGYRWGNTHEITKYISDTFLQERSRELIDKDTEAYEFAMLGLRLSSGFSLSEYERRFGHSFLEGKEEKLELFCKNDLLRIEDDRIYLTDRGFYVSITILLDLL